MGVAHGLASAETLPCPQTPPSYPPSEGVAVSHCHCVPWPTVQLPKARAEECLAQQLKAGLGSTVRPVSDTPQRPSSQRRRGQAWPPRGARPRLLCRKSSSRLGSGAAWPWGPLTPQEDRGPRELLLTQILSVPRDPKAQKCQGWPHAGVSLATCLCAFLGPREAFVQAAGAGIWAPLALLSLQ